MPERSAILSTLVPTVTRPEKRAAYIKLAPEHKYVDVDRVLDAPGPFTDEAFQGGEAAKQFLRGSCKVLVIGAGGLGCEILQNLALSEWSERGYRMKLTIRQWDSMIFTSLTWTLSIFPT